MSVFVWKMLIISTAEASYWNLYLTQEQVRFFEDSVRLASTLVVDSQTRFEAGRASELEVLEAQAGLALRQSKLFEARQRYHETAAQLLTLIALSRRSPDVFHFSQWFALKNAQR